jgi:hypothetical protein
MLKMLLYMILFLGLTVKYLAQQQLNTDSTKKQFMKPEIFTSGFIDIVNNGQINASARFIRLFIGEPGVIAIPLSLYSGVSNNNFQTQNIGVVNNSNSHLVNQFINPLNGMVNLSIDGIAFLRKQTKLSNIGIIYHIGERVLTGYKVGTIDEVQTGKPHSFLNSYGTLGWYMQTGAWERTNTKDMGIFWLAAR